MKNVKELDFDNIKNHWFLKLNYKKFINTTAIWLDLLYKLNIIFHEMLLNLEKLIFI